MAVKLEDSNMANYGSEEHKEMRRDAAKKEKCWIGAGQEVGLQIWRVNNRQNDDKNKDLTEEEKEELARKGKDKKKFGIEHWPKDRYGEFFNGDSYIILHTMENDEGKKSYDLFFWLGANSTQDEIGVAAYKTVELDDYLGDEPVQYREVQGNETKKYLNLFPKITILSGGVDSGFNQVKPTEYKPKLLHVTGYKKHVQVYEVPKNASSLNNCDSFVLDCGLSIFQFNGTKSSAWEKRKANAIVDELQASRHGKVKQTLIIDGLEDVGNPLIDEFWEELGGKPNQIKEEEEEEKEVDYELSLHQVSDASGKMDFFPVCKGQLDKSKLDSDDAFILDAGGKLFVWVGKGANKNEKIHALQYAGQYLTKLNRWKTPVERILEGQEPKAFWDAFAGKAVQGGRSTNSKKWKK